jgi:hypothetical protein
VANSGGKLSLFTKDGRLLHELSHSRNLYFFHPLDEGYIGRDLLTRAGRTVYRLNRYDDDLNVVGMFCEKEDNGLAFSGDFLFQVYGGNIYVGNVDEELEIQVYDGRGNRISSISHPYARPPVTPEHRQEHRQSLLERPGWDEYFGSREAYLEFLESRIRYPEHFPAVMKVHVADGRIYVVTYRQVNSMREILAMDLDGESLSSLTVPFRMISLLRHYPYAIGNGHLYQIVPGQAPGAWDLYATPLR